MSAFKPTFPRLASQPSPLNPALLTAKLEESGFTRFEDFLSENHLNPQDLADTIRSHEFAEHLKLKAAFVSLQIHLLALRCAPAAFGKLVALTDAEKPEVARRAATTCLSLAHISTLTDKTPATGQTLGPPPKPVPLSDPTTVFARIDQLFPFTNAQIKHLNQVDLTKINSEADAAQVLKFFTPDQLHTFIALLLGDPLPTPKPKHKPQHNPQPNPTPEPQATTTPDPDPENPNPSPNPTPPTAA